MSLESGKNVSSFLNDFVTDNASFNVKYVLQKKFRVDSACFSSVFLGTIVCGSDKLHYVDTNQKGALNFAQPSKKQTPSNILKC